MRLPWQSAGARDDPRRDQPRRGPWQSGPSSRHGFDEKWFGEADTSASTADCSWDEATGQQTALFHPRLDDWQRHFRWSEDFGTILGRTAVGRATGATLEMNHPRVVQIRLLWAALGLHPPG